MEDKIILLRVRGVLEEGNHSDIKFPYIEEFVKNKKAYFVLKNTHDLKIKEIGFELEVEISENIEEETISKYISENPSDFNKLIPLLMNALSIEKQEDEKTIIFENRLMGEVKRIINL